MLSIAAVFGERQLSRKSVRLHGNLESLSGKAGKATARST
jgi:hypothetical protein